MDSRGSVEPLVVIDHEAQRNLTPKMPIVVAFWGLMPDSSWMPARVLIGCELARATDGILMFGIASVGMFQIQINGTTEADPLSSVLI